MIDGWRARTESEQVDFFARSHGRFLRAKALAHGESRFYRLGGMIVCLAFAGDGLIQHIAPALEHLRVAPAEADLTVCAWDSRSTGVPMISAPCGREHINEQGEVSGFQSDRIRFAFNWADYSVNLLDHETRTGIYWVPDAADIPSWALAVPLRTLFHWWLEANGCQILHAAAAGTEHGAVLLTGRTGKGKSTAALSCLRSGLQYLGDDCVAVRLDPEPRVYSLYSAAKLNAEDLPDFPALADLVRNPEEAGMEKQVIFLHPRFARQLPAEMPLRAVLLPEIAGWTHARVVPAAGWKVARAFASISEMQLPHVGPRTRDFVARLCAAVPGYTLEAGPSHTTPQAIGRLLEGGAEAPVLRPASAATHAPQPGPWISVVLTVWNDERRIRNAVERILSQDYPALELIVVDDGSTDRTGEVLSRLPYPIRYIKTEHAGPAAARNRGIAEATGAFLAFVDVHDRWPDNALRRLAGELLRDPAIDVVHGEAQIVESAPGGAEGADAGGVALDFRAAAAIFRTSAFATAGPFDHRVVSAFDREWLARALAARVRVRRIEGVTLMVPRLAPAQRQTLERLGAVRLLKETLDRKRAHEPAHGTPPRTA